MSRLRRVPRRSLFPPKKWHPAWLSEGLAASEGGSREKGQQRSKMSRPPRPMRAHPCRLAGRPTAAPANTLSLLAPLMMFFFGLDCSLSALGHLCLSLVLTKSWVSKYRKGRRMADRQSTATPRLSRQRCRQEGGSKQGSAKC